MDKNERGKYLQKVRKSLGLRMEDAADNNISRGTISNIEKNKEEVSEDKVKHYCSILNIEYGKLSTLIKAEKHQLQKDEEYLNEQLKAIEDVIELSNPRKGIQQLKKLRELPDSLKPYYLFLKGRCHVRINKLELAKQYFVKSIKLIEKEPKLKKSNIQSFCYNQLAKLNYYQNDFEKSLYCTQKGIELFSENGNRTYLWYSLLMNKAVYLERLDNISEASEILKELIDKKDMIENTDIILNMHDVKANIYRKLKMYDEGITIVKKGLRLARINKRPNRTIELWTTLGSLYMDLGNLNKAETCLNTVLDLKKKNIEEHIFLPAFIKLGQLYTEQGKFKEAHNILNEAIKEGENVRVISTYVPAFIALGDCFLEQKLYKKAIPPYESALKLAKNHKLLLQERKILRKLCICWEHLDLKKFHEIIVRYFRVDVEINNKGGAGSDTDR